MNLYQYCGNNPVNFIDPWGQSWGHVKDMFLQWWHETGPSHRTFEEGSEEVRELRKSPGIYKALDEFYHDNHERIKKGKPPKKVEYQYFFGPNGALETGNNPTGQFCGGYHVTVAPNEDGTITITVTNDTNMRPFPCLSCPWNKKLSQK